jgi:hypothetical protein
MYELRTDGLRRMSKSNLPPEVVAAFAAPRADASTRPVSATPR